MYEVVLKIMLVEMEASIPAVLEVPLFWDTLKPEALSPQLDFANAKMLKQLELQLFLPAVGVANFQPSAGFKQMTLQPCAFRKLAHEFFSASLNCCERKEKEEGNQDRPQPANERTKKEGENGRCCAVENESSATAMHVNVQGLSPFMWSVTLASPHGSNLKPQMYKGRPKPQLQPGSILQSF